MHKKDFVYYRIYKLSKMAFQMRRQTSKIGQAVNHLRLCTRKLCDKPDKPDDKEYIPPGGQYR